MFDDNYEPRENLTPEERKRRTATPPGQDYRFTYLDPKMIAMNPPREVKPSVKPGQ